LRQLVDRVAPAEACEAAVHPRIVRLFVLRPGAVFDIFDPPPAMAAGAGAILPHRAQLQHPQRLAAPPYPPVGDERRAA